MRRAKNPGPSTLWRPLCARSGMARSPSAWSTSRSDWPWPRSRRRASRTSASARSTASAGRRSSRSVGVPSTTAQRRPYVLLLRALQESGMGAVGRFILRGQENFGLIRPRGDALALETLFVAEDVRSEAEIEEAVGDTEVKEAELDLARQVIDSLAGDFDPQDLVSEYRQDLRRLLEAKLAGEEIKAPEPVAEAPVIDLMEALRKSVAEAKGEAKPAAKRSSSKTKAAPKRRAAARK